MNFSLFIHLAILTNHLSRGFYRTCWKKNLRPTKWPVCVGCFSNRIQWLTDARQQVEVQPDPSRATRKMATAERVARRREQESRPVRLVLTPEITPANHLVDLFVVMGESGVMSYIKPEQCCSMAQEIQAIRKGVAVSTDASGMLKLGTKVSEPTCVATIELELRSAFQRQNFAMDLACLASCKTAEGWSQLLFSRLLRDPPRRFAKVSIQQLLCADQQLFTMASHETMGNLSEAPDKTRPLDEAISTLKEASDILQYLMPLPVSKGHKAPSASLSRPGKVLEADKGKGNPKGSGKTGGASCLQLPDGCTSHDDDNKLLCFALQAGKCKFKGPAGKRCARGFPKCYKKECFRAKPYHLCKLTDWHEGEASTASRGSPPLFVELFAGRGPFSQVALQAGLRVVSVDHEVVQLSAPVVTLDLTTESGSRLLWDILNAHGVAAVHFGLQRGTSSRARELPIPEAMKRAGVPEPPPVRSAEHALGIPALADHHCEKVNSANLLYRLAIEMVFWDHDNDVVISVENPANSWHWAALMAPARESSFAAAVALGKLQMVLFHACCHGSSRCKHIGANSKLLPPHFQGVRSEEEDDKMEGAPLGG